MWTHGPKDTWVAGADKLLHWDGEGWQEHPTPGFTASALWGAWHRDLWAVGREGSTGTAPRGGASPFPPTWTSTA